jgi:cell division protein FtsQ
MMQKGFKKSFGFKKRKIKYKRILFIIIFLTLISGLGYFFLFSSYFEIKEINVASKEIEKDEVKNAIRAEIDLAKNIFLANTGKATTILLNKFPKIDNLQIKRKFPSEIDISVEERKPIATFQFQNEYFSLDKKGVVFEKIPTELVYLPQIKIKTNFNILKEGDTICPAKIATTLAVIIDKFSNEIKIEIESIDIVSDYRVNVKTKEGWQAYLSLDNDIFWQMEKLDTLLKEKIPLASRINLKYIDLRFDKVYVFPETSS